MTSAPDHLKLFAVSYQLLTSDLAALEARLGIDLHSNPDESPVQDEDYYPQFEDSVKSEAAEMAAHYELFYCLEKSIRALIVEKLTAAHGTGWWGQAVPEAIRKNAEANIQREKDSGVTLRSNLEIDYTTFGELGEIVRTSWTTFSDIFNSQKAFDKVMTSLNILRAPIAHCSPLAPDEVLRLKLTLADWFRLME